MKKECRRRPEEGAAKPLVLSPSSPPWPLPQPPPGPLVPQPLPRSLWEMAATPRYLSIFPLTRTTPEYSAPASPGGSERLSNSPKATQQEAAEKELAGHFAVLFQICSLLGASICSSSPRPASFAPLCVLETGLWGGHRWAPVLAWRVGSFQKKTGGKEESETRHLLLWHAPREVTWLGCPLAKGSQIFSRNLPCKTLFFWSR